MEHNVIENCNFIAWVMIVESYVNVNKWNDDFIWIKKRYVLNRFVYRIKVSRISLMFVLSLSDKPECVKKKPVTLGVVTHRDAEVN